MEQNAIKKEMTQGLWHIQPPHTGIVIADEFITIQQTVSSDMLKATFVEDVERMGDANAAAICSAVNATYGNNISPYKVQEMYKMLQTIYMAAQPSDGKYIVVLSEKQEQELYNLIRDIKFNP